MPKEVDVSEIWDELKSLDVRERLVIVLRYGMIGPKGSSLTLNEVSNIINVTRERVRQIEIHALWKLMRRFGLLKDKHFYNNSEYVSLSFGKQKLMNYGYKQKILKYAYKQKQSFKKDNRNKMKCDKDNRNKMKCDFIDVFSGGFVFHFDPVKFAIDRSYTGLCGDGMKVVSGNESRWVYSDLESTPELTLNHQHS